MLNYTIIDLAHIKNEHLEFVNQAYRLWSSTYAPILISANQELDPMSFWRSKILTTITSGEDLVGIHLYNMFNLQLNSIRFHSYFSDLNASQYSELCQYTGSRFISGEFLTVNRSYRGNSKGFLWSEVIVGLSSKIFLASDCDYIIGISRVDKRVDQMTQAIGGVVAAEITKHDIKCKVIVANRKQIMPHPDFKTRAIIDSLWSSATNYSFLPINNFSKLRISA